MTKPLRIAIHGAAGRMGQRLVALTAADKELKLAAAIDAPGHPRLGQDAGVIAGVGPLGVPLASSLTPSTADVVIDFSLPAAAELIAQTCLAQKVPLVMGTLGKALGCSGAFVAGSAELIETLVQHARTFIYTTALPPAVAVAARTTLVRVRNRVRRR